MYGGPGEKRDGGMGERGVGMREEHSIRKNDEGGYAEKSIFLIYTYALLGKRVVSLMFYFTFLLRVMLETGECIPPSAAEEKHIKHGRSGGVERRRKEEGETLLAWTLGKINLDATTTKHLCPPPIPQTQGSKKEK